MSVVSIPTPFHIELELIVAPFGRRVLAWLIDALLQALYWLGFMFAVRDSLPDDETIRIVVMTFGLTLPVLLYHFGMEVFFHGQSVGKMLVGIRVVNVTGNEASISQYLIRLLFRSYFLVPLIASVTISLFFDITAAPRGMMFGIWALAFSVSSVAMFLYFVTNKLGQRLGDTFANTLVIADRARAEFHKTIYLEISDRDYKPLYPEVMNLSDKDINGIRNLLDVSRITREHEAYMERISGRITEVLGITTEQEPFDFLARLLRDYNYLTSK